MSQLTDQSSIISGQLQLWQHVQSGLELTCDGRMSAQQTYWQNMAGMSVGTRQQTTQTHKHTGPVGQEGQTEVTMTQDADT